MRSRREYLALAGSGGAALLAGCIEQFQEEEEEPNYEPVQPNVSVEGETYNNEQAEIADPNESDEEGQTDGSDSDPDSDASDETEPEPTADHLVGLSGSTAPGEERGSTSESFSWEFRGSSYSLEVSIPDHLLDYYSARERVSNDWGTYISDPFDLEFLESVAQEIQSLADDKMQGVELTVAFVQQLPYSTDEVSAGTDQYARFPVETLANGGGDCEDTAILLSELLLYQGFGSVLLGYPDQAHMALGLQGDDSVSGTYYEARGNRYYYVETTAPGWEVGQVPDSLDPSSREFHWADDEPVLVMEWVTRERPSGLQVRANVTNVGPAAAQEVDLIAESQVRGGEGVAGQRSDKQTIPSQESHEFVLSFDPPADREQRISVQIGVGGYLHGESASDWQTPE